MSNDDRVDVKKVPNPLFNPETNPDVERTVVAPIVEMLDVGYGPSPARRHARDRVAKTLACKAKAEFGVLAVNEVNQAVVRAFVLREAKQVCVHDHHLVGVVTMAVFFFWLPTSEETMCQQAMASHAVTTAVNARNQVGYHRVCSWLPSWMPFNRAPGLVVAKKQNA